MNDRIHLMSNHSLAQSVYSSMAAAFCVIVIISNIISAKMIYLPYLPNVTLPAGAMTYPLAFFLSDLVTEIFGTKKAKQMVYMAFMMNLLSFGMIQIALMLPTSLEEDRIAFQTILGLSGWRIFSSLVAYLSAQILGIQLYALIKHWTGERFLWLRNNGAACVSQFVDTMVVDTLYLYGVLGMGMLEVLGIIFMSYGYKVIFSVVSTPLFYLCVFLAKVNWGRSGAILKANHTYNKEFIYESSV